MSISYSKALSKARHIYPVSPIHRIQLQMFGFISPLKGHTHLLRRLRLPRTSTSPDQNRGPRITALAIVVISLPTIAIILRIRSRLLSNKQRLWWDDWFAIASLVCSARYLDPNRITQDSLIYWKPCVLGFISLILQSGSDGLGRNTSQLAPDKIALGPKYVYALNILYGIALSLPKYSAILFYLRLFKPISTFLRINVFIT